MSALRTRIADAAAVVGLTAMTLALTLPAIMAGVLGPKAYDHRLFHLPLVREWATTWPRVDVSDYNSATGPLYHFVLAGVAQWIGTDGGPETSAALQTASALFAATLVVVVYAFARRVLPPTIAFMIPLPLLFSPYVLGNAIWMMTDNLSLTLVAATTGLAAFGAARPATRLGQGVAAAAAVATRQINVWLCAPMVVAWWLSGRRATASFLVACALPVVTLAMFVVAWHGLVPPRFRSLHASGLNPAAIGFTLTLCGAYGCCLLVAAPDGVRAIVRRPGTLVGMALLGAALAAIGPSFASEAAGRNGGWVWSSVARMPVIADRSPLLIVGGAFGAVVLAMLFASVEHSGRKNAALVILASLAGFVAAHVANAQVFQRYYDPMVLLTLVLLATLLPNRRTQVIAILLLAMQQAIFAMAVLYRPMLS